MTPSSFPSSGREKTNDPHSCSSSSTTSAASEEKKRFEEEKGTWSERKQHLIRKIEEIEAKHHDEKAAEVQAKEEAKHRREAAAQYQTKIQTQTEELCSRQAEFQRQIEEIQRQRECLMDKLKLHGHKEQSNREREQQAGRRHKLNLQQIQSQADELRRTLEDHDKQRPVCIPGVEKSAQQVLFLISISMYLSFAILNHE